MRDRSAYVVAVVVALGLGLMGWTLWSDRTPAAGPASATAKASGDDQLPPGAITVAEDVGAPTVRSLEPPPNRFDHLVPRGPERPTRGLRVTGAGAHSGAQTGAALVASGDVSRGHDIEAPLRPSSPSSGRGGGPIE